MKKILSILKDINTQNIQVENYCNYNLHLARDKNLYLDFIYNFKMDKSIIPASIAGTGLSYPQIIEENESLMQTEEELIKLIKPLMLEHRKINYILGKGDLPSKINILSDRDNYLMCTMQNISNESWYNVLFGTDETSVSKSTDLPCLYIPKNYKYEKAENMLLFIDEYDQEKFDDLKQIANHCKLNVRIVVEDKMDKEVLKIIQNELVTLKTFDTAIVILGKGQFEEAIIKGLVKKYDSDWITFMNYGKSFLERLYTENANRLLLRSSLPTIIV